MFTEYGYTARPDPTLRPWEWPDGMQSACGWTRARRPRATARCWRPSSKRWFVGGFVWRYYSNPMDASQEAAHGFSPRLREGERVLRELYALRWESDSQEPYDWRRWW
jgi:hypothetical protein